MAVEQPAGAVRGLITGTASDQLLSLDGKIVYVARGGTVTGYDVASGATVATFALGTRLGAMDLSADGRYLVATDLAPGSTSGTWPSITTNYSIYRVDLSTGQATTYTIPVTDAYPTGFGDVAFLSDGTVLLGGTDQWDSLATYNFETGTKTLSSQSYYPAALTASGDHSRILVSDLGISDAPLHIWTAGSGITASHQGYADNIQGYNGGAQALSRDGKLTVQGVSLAVYDQDLKLVTKLADRYSFSVAGLAFSPDATRLYVLDGATKQVFVLSTSNWDVLGGYPVGAGLGSDGYSAYSPATSRGNALLVSPDGSTLLVAASGSVQVIDLNLAVSVTGTSAGNDQLVGDSDANVLYGFEGNDLLDGRGGNDTMYGGAGDDTYVVDSPSDAVIETANGGIDTIRSSVSYYSPYYSSVENLVLVGDQNLYGYGNDLANTITGNSGANGLYGLGGDDVLIGGFGDDRLDGGAGNDRLEGGAGDDTYVLDQPGDTVVERAGEGRDTVVVAFSYTLGAEIENLLLDGGTATISGTGNDLDNVLTGNQGDNVLTGLGGNDVVIGGAGTDTAVFRSTLAGTSLGFGGPGTIIVSGSDGRDRVSLVEALRFADGTLDLGTSTAMASARTVASLYGQWGGRDPFASEVLFWMGEIDAGRTSAAGVRAAILSDPLGRAHTDAVVTDLYQTLGGRAPDANELSYWANAVTGGMTFGAVRSAILADPLGHDAAGVIAMYQNYGGRDPSADELAVWRGLYANGATSATVRSAILADPLGQNHVADQITELYLEYGGRTPTSGEVAVWQGLIRTGAELHDVRSAILADPLGQEHLTDQLSDLYMHYFGRNPRAGEFNAWRGLIGGGADYDAVADALITDGAGNRIGTTSSYQMTSAADVLELNYVYTSGVAVNGFDPSVDRINAYVPIGQDPLQAFDAHQVMAVDGTRDVMLTLLTGSVVILNDVNLADLSAANFIGS